MSKKVVEKGKEILVLSAQIESIGFYKVNSEKYQREMELQAKNPVHIQKPEVGFSFIERMMEAVVIITNNENEYTVRTMVRHENTIIFRGPYLKSKRTDIMNKVSAWTEIIQNIVRHQPRCPECKHFMDIKKTDEYFWTCSKKEKHEKGFIHNKNLASPLYGKLSERAQKIWNEYETIKQGKVSP